ncbi:MAG: hypothetical protein K8I27_08280 [Planctomycetes bacterium]|nr:hypothetical protein [Planctomycetota bacterium]
MRDAEAEKELDESAGLLALKFFALLMVGLALGFCVYEFLQPPESLPGLIVVPHPLVYLFGP